MFKGLTSRIGFLPRPGDDISVFVLAPFGVSLALILAAFVALFFAFGFWWPYWRVGDMDIWMVYQAFLMNDGHAQQYFDHPGYLTIVSLQHWLALLKSAGLIAADRLSQLPPLADVAGSEKAWMTATQAARLLSLGYACAFIALFGVLVRRLLGDWQVALIAAFVLAFSSGVMMEGRIVRTELISATLAYAALLLCLIAGDLSRPLRLAAILLASVCATLALINKVQFLFLLMTFAPIVFSARRAAPPMAARTPRHLFAWGCPPLPCCWLFLPHLPYLPDFSTPGRLPSGPLSSGRRFQSIRPSRSPGYWAGRWRLASNGGAGPAASSGRSPA